MKTKSKACKKRNIVDVSSEAGSSAEVPSLLGGRLAPQDWFEGNTALPNSKRQRLAVGDVGAVVSTGLFDSGGVCGNVPGQPFLGGVVDNLDANTPSVSGCHETLEVGCTAPQGIRRSVVDVQGSSCTLLPACGRGESIHDGISEWGTAVSVSGHLKRNIGCLGIDVAEGSEKRCRNGASMQEPADDAAIAGEKLTLCQMGDTQPHAHLVAATGHDPAGIVDENESFDRTEEGQAHLESFAANASTSGLFVLDFQSGNVYPLARFNSDHYISMAVSQRAGSVIRNDSRPLILDFESRVVRSSGGQTLSNMGSGCLASGTMRSAVHNTRDFMRTQCRTGDGSTASESNDDGGAEIPATERWFTQNVAGPPAEYRRFGSCNQVCRHCRAMFWEEERLSCSTSSTGCLYHLCCFEGTVKLFV